MALEEGRKGGLYMRRRRAWAGRLRRGGLGAVRVRDGGRRETGTGVKTGCLLGFVGGEGWARSGAAPGRRAWRDAGGRSGYSVAFIGACGMLVCGSCLLVLFSGLLFSFD